jgi:predicted NAD/FAD-binding protein
MALRCAPELEIRQLFGAVAYHRECFHHEARRAPGHTGTWSSWNYVATPPHVSATQSRGGAQSRAQVAPLASLILSKPIFSP